MRFAQFDHNDRITRIYRSASPLADSDASIPDDTPAFVGMARGEFTETWKLRPLSARVEKGLLQLDPRSKLVGESIAPKSKAELIRDGLEPAPKGTVLDGNQLRPLTTDEQLASGLIDADTAANLKRDEATKARRQAYVDELDPIRADIFRAQLAGDTESVDRLTAEFQRVDAAIRQRIPVA